MGPMEYTVTEEARLDAFLALQEAELSRSRIQSAIKEGLVSVNDTVIKKPAYKLSEADTVVLDEAAFEPEISDTQIDPMDMNLEVLFEDDAMMVINKPAGISVHPGHSMEKDEKTILHGIAYLFEERSIPFSAEAVLAHRLDKPTTGCLCVVKNYNTHGALQKQFQDRTVKKYYLCIVAGVPEHATATIDAPIGRSLTDRTKMSVLKTSVSREAKTTYTVLDHTNYTSLLRCDLHTGRTHQIRVHLTSIGYPILGDTAYFSVKSTDLSSKLSIPSLCLHAESITFVSPADEKQYTVKAPLPDTFFNALEQCSLTLGQERS